MASPAKEVKKGVGGGRLTEPDLINVVDDLNQGDLGRFWVLDKQDKIRVVTMICRQWGGDTRLREIVKRTAGDVLDEVLTTLVDRGMWASVQTALGRGISDSLRRWAIEKACAQCDHDYRLNKMMKQYDGDKCDDILTTLVERGMWMTLFTVMKMDISHTKRRWAVEKASRQCNHDYRLRKLVSHCDADMVDDMLTLLVQKGMWRSVLKMLKRGVRGSLRRWAVKEACRRCDDDYRLKDLVIWCDGDIMDDLLTCLVDRGMWKSAHDLLTRGVSDSKRRESVEKACALCGDDNQLKKLVVWCDADMLDDMLTLLIERGMWQSIVKVIGRGVSDSIRRRVVQEACARADDLIIENAILDHCDDDQLDLVLTSLVERGMWWSVGKVLERGVSELKQWTAVHEACKWADDDILSKTIAIYCADNLLDTVLTLFVEREKWKSAGGVLKRGVSDSLQRWAVLEACKRTDDKCIDDIILPFCTDDLLDSVLKILVDREMWLSAGEVLTRTVSDSRRQWAVVEACKRAEDKYINDIVLQFCTDDVLDSVLKTLCDRGMWLSVGGMLKRGVDDSQRRWVVYEACKGADDDCIKSAILPFCEDDLLDSAVETLVDRGMWKSVRRALNRSVSDLKLRWAVQEACKRARNQYIKAYFLPLCPDDMLDSVFQILMDRGLWLSAGEVLKRGVSDSLKQWAVPEVCKRADDRFIEETVLPVCTDHLQDSVLKTLVDRGMWRSVQKLLKRGVTEFQQQGATQEACKQSASCTHGQLDSVLRTLMEWADWNSISKLLKRGVSECQRQWALQEASKSSGSAVKCILPYCTDHDVDVVLAKIVKQKKSENINSFFEACSDRIVNIPKTFEVTDEDSVIRHILPHHKYLKLDRTVRQLAAAAKWRAVGVLLHHCVTDLFFNPSVYVVDTWKEIQDRQDKRFGELVQGGCGLANRLPLKIWTKVCKERTETNRKDITETTLALLCEAVMESVREMWIHGVGKQGTDESYLADEQDEATLDQMIHRVRETSLGVDSTDSSAHGVVKEAPDESYLADEQDEATLDQVIPGVNEISLGVDSTGSSTHGVEKKVPDESCLADEQDEATLDQVIQGVNETSLGVDSTDSSWLSQPMDQCRPDIHNDTKQFALAIRLLKRIMDNVCWHKYRKDIVEELHPMLVTLSTSPMFPRVQSVLLHVLLRHRMWDVLSKACLSHVVEQDRRRLFNAALEQRQLAALRRWADHTVYDNKRLWAMKVAFKEKLWEVYLLLSDYGIEETERLGVYCRLVRYADWDIVRLMMDTVADAAEVRDLLLSKIRNPVRRPVWTHEDAPDLEERLDLVEEYEIELRKKTQTVRTLKCAVERGEWCVVRRLVRHNPRPDDVRFALRAAVENRQWPVVMLMVRHEEDAALLDELFREMVELQQWAVCRVLLEARVSDRLRLELLPQLMCHRQWQLVSIVMRCEMDDDLRRQVMQRALEAREGSVVWQCIIHMKKRMTVAEREAMFQQAFYRDVWQAVKPLVEMKDDMGIQHRDAALLETIDQHQWDTVDYCLRFQADINMLDENGHTPIHRSARERDWTAVKELAMRGGDTSLLDRSGQSVLHRAIDAKHWDMVKLLIQYHGNVHQADTVRGLTPLQMLIDTRQGDIILLTLLWCPNQGRGLSARGETPLHAVCLSVELRAPPDSRAFAAEQRGLDLLLARKVEPFAVTKQGLSALAYAVLNDKCPQRMVEECIRLGINKRQPNITDTTLLDEASHVGYYPLLVSPVLLAVLRGLPDVTRILYECGSCSKTELSRLCTLLSPSHRTDLIPAKVNNSFTRLCGELIGGVPEWSEEERQKSVEYLTKVISTHHRLQIMLFVGTSPGPDGKEEEVHDALNTG